MEDAPPRSSSLLRLWPVPIFAGLLGWEAYQHFYQGLPVNWGFVAICSAGLIWVVMVRGVFKT